MIKEFKEAFKQAFKEAFTKEIRRQFHLPQIDSNDMIKRIQMEDKSWSIWILSTRHSIQIVSVSGRIDGAIPEDGSFISAFRLHEGITEQEADKILENYQEETS